MIYHNVRDIPIGVINSGEPVLGRIDYHKKFMAAEILNKLSIEDLDKLFNIVVLDPFSPKGTKALSNIMNPDFGLYRMLEYEEKIRITMELNIPR